MNAKDFTTGVDVTAVDPMTAGDFNNLIELAVPTANGSAEVGKGICLISTDTALNIPDVPDASVTTKWKRYAWLRRPFAGASDTRVAMYCWNDDSDNDATYLKWSKIDADSEALETLTSLANNALSTANDAVTTAELSAINSSAAVVTANAAAADAATALANSITAIASVAVANAAVVTANSASAQAAAAYLAATNGNVVYIRLTATAAATDSGKNLEITADGTAFQIYHKSDKVAIFSENAATTVNAPNSAAASNLRILTTTVKAATWATLTGAGRITLLAGRYLVEGWSTGYAINHQTLLYDNTTAAYIAYGNSIYGTGVNINTLSHAAGYVEVVAASEDIQINTLAAAVVANGLGRATGLSAIPEIYTVLKITRLN